MAIGSSLTKHVGKTGRSKNHKPPLDWPSSDSSKSISSFRKGSNQGDSDSEATSSMHGSTSSANSTIDRYVSGVKRGIQRNILHDKLNSKKPTNVGSLRMPLMSLPDGSPNNFQKPEHKFTRILRSNTATFSSVLKDSKFPEHVDPPEVKVTASKEVVYVAKLCPYRHCSLHSRHHQNPPHKSFSYLKRRSSENQKNINPQVQTTCKKTEDKVTKKVTSKGKKNKNVDDSIEFYTVLIEVLGFLKT